jgi:hypothetical protein
LSTWIDFDVPVSTNVPEFYFVSVTDDEVCNTVMMSFKSNAAEVDEIPISFITLMPVLLGTLTHVFNHIFTCSEFPARWEGLCCAANSKGCCPREISNYRPISLLACLSKF